MLPLPPSIPTLTAQASRPARGDHPANLGYAWHGSSPLARFLQQLPYGAYVLECGAGGGATATYVNWLQPVRPDLKLFGLDLEDSPGLHHYTAWQCIDYASPKAFEGLKFDAICSSNFVEHIDGGIHSLAPWAASRLKDGGQLFVQGPSANMKALDRTPEYHAAGLITSTMHFYDDTTHLDTHTLDEMRQATECAGFLVEESGYWRNRFVEDEMLRQGFAQGEQTYTTYAIWLKSYVEQYVSAVKLR